jgi:hypothetical protein
MGLVVDFGWAYWRKEAAYTAANAAATAAIAAANSVSNQICGAGADQWNCSSTSYGCAANHTTPAAANLDNGCLYAKQNGFLNTGRQSVGATIITTSPWASLGTSGTYIVQ